MIHPTQMLLLVPLVYAGAVAQTSLADLMQVGHVTPDLLALVAMIWLLSDEGPWAFLVAGATGLAGDLVSLGRVGLGMACFLLAGYLVARLRAKLSLSHPVWQAVLIAVAVAGLAAGLALGRWLLGETAVPLQVLLGRAAGVGAYTAGVSLPLLMVIGWVGSPSAARRERLLV